MAADTLRPLDPSHRREAAARIHLAREAAARTLPAEARTHRVQAEAARIRRRAEAAEARTLACPAGARTHRAEAVAARIRHRAEAAAARTHRAEAAERRRRPAARTQAREAALRTRRAARNQGRAEADRSPAREEEARIRAREAVLRTHPAVRSQVPAAADRSHLRPEAARTHRAAQNRGAAEEARIPLDQAARSREDRTRERGPAAAEEARTQAVAEEARTPLDPADRTLEREAGARNRGGLRTAEAAAEEDRPQQAGLHRRGRTCQRALRARRIACRALGSSLERAGRSAARASIPSTLAERSRRWRLHVHFWSERAGAFGGRHATAASSRCARAPEVRVSMIASMERKIRARAEHEHAVLTSPSGPASAL